MVKSTTSAATGGTGVRSYLGLPGDPVEWTDRCTLSDHAIAFPRKPDGPNGMLDLGHHNELLRDLTPRDEPAPAGATPFGASLVCRAMSMRFDSAATVREPMVISGTGFGARGRMRRG